MGAAGADGCVVDVMRAGLSGAGTPGLPDPECVAIANNVQSQKNMRKIPCDFFDELVSLRTDSQP